MKFEYPLQYPLQQERTVNPTRARFITGSVSKAGNKLLKELLLLGAENLIISSNLTIRLTGDGFYANQRVEDSGIAIYFKLNGDNKVMACDKWDRAEHNLWALYLSVQAIRGLDRWGGSEFLDGLFRGFKALPTGVTITPQSIEYFNGITDMNELRVKYKELARKLHPDMKDGDIDKFKTMKNQYEDIASRIG